MPINQIGAFVSADIPGESFGSPKNMNLNTLIQNGRSSQPFAAARGNGAGFTLVEIMIVVAVIALLAAIALPNLSKARQNAQNAAFAASLRVAVEAFEIYAAENGEYPPDVTPAVVPDQMEDYLGRFPWTEETPVGGSWDWDNGQFGHTAGVSVYQPSASRSQMEKIDEIVDDGDLDAGIFQSRNSGYIYLIEH